MDSGDILELWRPDATSGKDDPHLLADALSTAVHTLGLEPKAPLPPYHNPRFDEVGPGGLLLRTVLRFPKQVNLKRTRAYTVDWITLTAQDVSDLLPPTSNSPLSFDVNEALAERFLVHFRPPLDTAQDLENTAMKLVHEAVLRGQIISQSEQVTEIAYTGAITMVRPLWMGPIERLDDKWTGIRRANIRVRGYIKMETASRGILDTKFDITEATMIPTDGRLIWYKGMAKLEKDKAVSQVPGSQL